MPEATTEIGVRRSIALIVLVLGLLVPTWIHGPDAPDHVDRRLIVYPEQIRDPVRLARDLGPFRLEQAWQLQGSAISGYSALLALSAHELLAVSDSARWLRVAMPPGGGLRHAIGSVDLQGGSDSKELRDVESATRDPQSGTIWLGMEGVNAILRMTPQLEERARIAPSGMREWGDNTGPEALARLADGRFVVLKETPIAGSGGRRHEGLVFNGDPTRGAKGQPIEFDGPRNFSVVDMAPLPDGRVLLLMRRLVWPMPLRFAGRIVIADPAQIARGRVWKAQQVAILASDMPIDNFEGMAVHARKDGSLTVWLISDNNGMNYWQRTLLWKLSVDPGALPWPGRRGD